MYPCDSKSGDRKSNLGYMCHVLNHLLFLPPTTFTPPLGLERLTLLADMLQYK